MKKKIKKTQQKPKGKKRLIVQSKPTKTDSPKSKPFSLNTLFQPVT